MADAKFSDYPGMKNAEYLFSCTAMRSEWVFQKVLCDADKRIIPFYGTHPWYISDGIDGLENILNENENACVGEIGLDFNYPDKELQTSFFERQLQLASYYGRAVSIHVCKTEKETLDSLRKFKLKKIILHSFSSESYVAPFSKLGCYFSLSPRILSKSDEKISKLLNSIPMEKLLIETDAPNCKDSIFDLVDRIGSLSGMPQEEVLFLTSENAKRLIE